MSHRSYVMLAKTRAKALWVLLKFLPIPRPMLYVGESATQDIIKLIINRQPRHVLIVTDEVLNKLGVIKEAQRLLDDANIAVSVYDQVTPDPTYSVVEGGLSMANDTQCDVILAIGGGSVIDAAKMIALSQANCCHPRKLIGFFKARKAGTPFYVLPTTSGTGSEATIGAVISDDKTHQKAICIDPKIVPIATGIDPNILQGMPPKVTADTGIDVLTHALEAWMSVNYSADTDYYAATAVQKVMQYLPIAYQDGKDLKAREEMGVAAHYAGIALNKAGLGYVHGIAHQLGAFHGIPHGQANAIVLPYILGLNAEVASHRLALLAKKIGMVADRSAGQSDSQIAREFINQVKQLLKDLNIQTKVTDMKEEDFDTMIQAAAKEISDTYAVPRYLTHDEIRQVLRQIRDAA